MELFTHFADHGKLLYRKEFGIIHRFRSLNLTIFTLDSTLSNRAIRFQFGILSPCSRCVVPHLSSPPLSRQFQVRNHLVNVVGVLKVMKLGGLAKDDSSFQDRHPGRVGGDELLHMRAVGHHRSIRHHCAGLPHCPCLFNGERSTLHSVGVEGGHLVQCADHHLEDGLQSHLKGKALQLLSLDAVDRVQGLHLQLTVVLVQGPVGLVDARGLPCVGLLVQCTAVAAQE
mmetsp:Transcript_1893/g.6755  ORF Transcript_1893/g.6755 Transcript_1893/m.6755 type:complete len:228 (+) Transcript_1893:152-835(+)